MSAPEERVLTTGAAALPRARPARLSLLLGAAHIGPAVAVTAFAALLALAEGLPAFRAVIVTAAVLAGQLTIGWGNDLRDAARDRQVSRTDKPLATGELKASTVIGCLLAAAVACVALSFLVGWRSALVHLCLAVAWGHLYNLWLKATPWSWLPYAVAFGALPAVVTLAGVPPQWPPMWLMLAAGLLGVAAHFLNTLPDHEDDAATGVRGLPQRLGQRPSRVIASLLLVVASVAAVLGPPGEPVAWSWGALLLVAGLAVVALTGRGKAPFHAAIAIALVDVVLLVAVAS